MARKRSLTEKEVLDLQERLLDTMSALYTVNEASSGEFFERFDYAKTMADNAHKILIRMGYRAPSKPSYPWELEPAVPYGKDRFTQ